jgi:hypothetical protein
MSHGFVQTECGSAGPLSASRWSNHSLDSNTDTMTMRILTHTTAPDTRQDTEQREQQPHVNSHAEAQDLWRAQN